MDIVHKPLSFLLILFIIFFLNLTTFSDSRAINAGIHNSKGVEDQPVVNYPDLGPIRLPVEPPPTGSVGFPGSEMGKNDQGDVFLNELTQGSYGAPYDYGYPLPGGIFGFPRGFFGFPRGLFGFPRGFFGFPRGFFGFPGGYGRNPGGYDGGRPGDKPWGGGYGGIGEVKGK